MDSETRMQLPLVERAQKGQQTSKLVSCLANIWSEQEGFNWRNTAFLARKAESDPVALLQNLTRQDTSRRCVCRDANVLRVRGALAFTDASKPGAGAVVDPVIMSHFCRNILR